MTLQIRRAERQMAKIKIALTGVSGSGKTWSALAMARGLAGPEGRILMGDTENRSGDLYAESFVFDKVDIEPPFGHDKFEELVKVAHSNGYDVLIIDSASHFWEGILEYKGALDKRGGNSFTNWNEAGDRFKLGLNAILQTPINIIVCLRSKTEYAVEKDGGKTSVRKVGLAPVFRDGCEYEFSAVLDIAIDHTAISAKDRTGLFKDVFTISEETGKKIAEWLSTAKPEPPKPESAPATTSAMTPAEEKAKRVMGRSTHALKLMPKGEDQAKWVTKYLIAAIEVCAISLRNTFEECDIAELSAMAKNQEAIAIKLSEKIG
jgi:AAA domain-containing protein